MESRPTSPLHAELFEHGDFLRRLAQRLVEDEHHAADLVQEARLAALVRPPPSGHAPRAWLARVVRNLASNAVRGLGRREHRERLAARPELEPGPHELAQRLEIQHQLAREVARLDEPYRVCIYLRFYEGLPPREIAARVNAPVSTVQTRLQRALERLRRRLDDSSDGDRSSWCAALGHLLVRRAAEPGALSVGLLGGVLVNAKLAVALAVVVGLALVVFTWPPDKRSDGAAQPDLSTAGAVANPATRAADGRMRGAVLGDPDDSSRTRGEVAAAAGTAGPGGWRIVGRVADVEGAPISGSPVSLMLVVDKHALHTTTDAHGEYAVDLTLPAGLSPHAALKLRASADAPGFRAVSQLKALDALASGEDREVRADFTLERARVVRGRIEDAQGSARAGVRVCAVDDRGAVSAVATSGQAGAFALALDEQTVASGGPDLWVAAAARAGFACAGPYPVPEGEDLDVGRVVLRFTDVITGRVALPDGQPVPDIAIEFLAADEDLLGGGPTESWIERSSSTHRPRFRDFDGVVAGTARTDADGRFASAGLLLGVYELSLGRLEAFDMDRHSLSNGPVRTGEFVEIVVDAYRLRVRVMDESGLALPGANLSIMKGRGGTGASTGGIEGRLDVPVSPGSWTVTASHEGAATATREVEVLEGIHGYEVELVLDFDPEIGALAIELKDDVGTTVEDFKVVLFLDGGQISVFHGLKPGADGVVEEVPVGDYLVRVLPGNHHTSYRFPTEAPASVREGETTKLSLNTRRGGFLRFALRGNHGVESVRPTQVELELSDAYGAPPEALHLLSTRNDDGSITYGSPGVGQHARSQLLMPGDYTLRVAAEGYAPQEQAVRVLPLETTEVEVLLVVD